MNSRISWLDRAILAVAPAWGRRRIAARAAARFARHYEAASGGRRTAGWYRMHTDANAAAGPSIQALREFSRDLRRNNAWARRGVQVIVNGTVGWGVVPKPSAVAKEAKAVWKLWAETALCDFDGRLPFAGLQRLVMSTVVESGAALVLLEVDDDERLPVPLRIRVLEPDYLDQRKDGPVDGAGGNVIIQGIEFDRRGRRVAYHLHRHHPGASGGGRLIDPRGLESRRVPADDVLHVYQVERAGGVQGIPWLASVIAKLNDLDEYEDGALMQQKIASFFGAFVQDFDGLGTALGGADPGAPPDPLIETLEPGSVNYLPPGKTVAFPSPPSAQSYDPFTKANLRRIAAGLGVTYEDLTGDYGQVNYSSARMARLGFYRNVDDWRWNMLIPQFCDGVWRRVMALAAPAYGWATVPSATWTPPPIPMLDPDKEGLAYQRLVRSGAMTLFGMIRELGYDPDEHLAEIATGNKRLDELEIWLDSDPRRIAAGGAIAHENQGPNQAEEDDDAEEVDLDDDEGDSSEEPLAS